MSRGPLFLCSPLPPCTHDATYARLRGEGIRTPPPSGPACRKCPALAPPGACGARRGYFNSERLAAQIQAEAVAARGRMDRSMPERRMGQQGALPPEQLEELGAVVGGR